ncbi:MAG: 4-hydroxythreonine-4-phosphate dehydrogenase PdxA [bacterium]
MSRSIVLCLTLGDIGGIGPEVVLKTVYRFPWPRCLRFVIVGSSPVLREEARKLHLPCAAEWTPGSVFPSARTVVWDPGPFAGITYKPGTMQESAARAAVAWVAAAAGSCTAGCCDGMVTAPICKEGLDRAGIKVPGHTELLAELTGTRRYAMMLVGGCLRVVLATRHIALKDVPGELSIKGIVAAGQLAGEALPWLGASKTTLAVCGLNPHAGDGGVLGSEEKSMIVPAIKALRRKGLSVVGPVPADTVFHAAVRGDYGAVLAMYHDQGLGPLKTVAFDSGVNVTLGLPIVRTSPDHGTAFDIAGRGIASPRSMVNAVRLAYKLATRPNPWADMARSAAHRRRGVPL